MVSGFFPKLQFIQREALVSLHDTFLYKTTTSAVSPLYKAKGAFFRSSS